MKIAQYQCTLLSAEVRHVSNLMKCWNNTLLHLLCFFALLLLTGIAKNTQAEPTVLTLSVPGPGTAFFLPAELITRIGADKEEGVQLKITYVGSGVLSLNQLMKRNVDFAMSGLPAAMSMRAKGGKVVSIAAAGNVENWMLIVRSDLKATVKKISDLKGLRIGLSSSTPSSRTTGQQFMELLLNREGMRLDDVRVVSTGLSWNESSSMLYSNGVDAILADVLIASRLLADGKAFSLVDLGGLNVDNKFPGAHYLHASLNTREDIVELQPRMAEKMVSILRRSLSWIKSHTPEQIVAQMKILDKQDRKALLLTLRANPNFYSTDARFSEAQIKDTEIFFRNANKDEPAAQSLQLNSMIDERWAGVKP